VCAQSGSRDIRSTRGTDRGLHFQEASMSTPIPPTGDDVPEKGVAPEPAAPTPAAPTPAAPTPAAQASAAPAASVSDHAATDSPAPHPQASDAPAPHTAAPDAPAPGAPARTVTEAMADRLDDDGFFSALFDITFTKFVTRKLAGPVYVVGLTLIALGIVLGFVSSISAAIATQSFWGVFLFLLDLLLTVVGGVLAILLLRVGIEVFVAVVAIAENTRPHRKRDNQ
jgi:Domain of unknown function (DUF4282)